MKYSIQRFTKSMTIVSGQTTINATGLSINGLVRSITIVAPDMTGATFSIFVKDANTIGHTLFTKATLAKNTTHVILLDASNNPLQIPLTGLSALTITSIGAEGADRTFSVELLVDRQ